MALASAADFMQTDAADTPIEELGLSTRSFSALQRGGDLYRGGSGLPALAIFVRYPEYWQAQLSGDHWGSSGLCAGLGP